MFTQKVASLSSGRERGQPSHSATAGPGGSPADRFRFDPPGPDYSYFLSAGLLVHWIDQDSNTRTTWHQRYLSSAA